MSVRSDMSSPPPRTPDLPGDPFRETWQTRSRACRRGRPLPGAPAGGPPEQPRSLARHDPRVLPEAGEGLAYGVPAFRLNGKLVAGFAAHTKHVNYLPHSGSVVGELGEVLAGYDTTKGSVKFPPGGSLPADVVRALVAARLAELGFDEG